MIKALFGVVVFILNIVAIVSVIRSSASTGAKILWIILILLLPIVGMLLYFLLGPRPYDTAYS